MSGEGVDKVWSTMTEFRSIMEESGELEDRRRNQHLRWMWSYVEERLVRMARYTDLLFSLYENHDIAIAMSPSRADPVLPWAGCI